MRLMRFALPLFGWSFFASAALAQEVDPAAERSTAFRAVEGPVRESVAGGPLLVAAYALILTLLVLYVIRLGWMARKLSATVERVRGGLEHAGVTREASRGPREKAGARTDGDAVD